VVSLARRRPTPGEYRQEIRFCRGVDNARIAYAIHGDGPPLVVVSCWLSHLQFDWQSPVWRHFLDDLGRIATVVRYDERGFGLSDWSVSDFSLDARYADLEAVIEDSGLDRFALIGMSGGAPVALAYAARHPERVTRLISYGGSARWPAEPSPEADVREEAFQAMIRAGWAQPDNLFRRVFTSIFIPEATEEQLSWVDNLQRMSTSTENAIASRVGRRQVDVRPLLPELKAPTLVLHARGDRAVRFPFGSEVASLIPGARLVELDSSNHILLGDEPAWQHFRRELTAFIAPDARRREASSPATALLTLREREVLERATQGLSNGQIASELALSPRTVERHLSNAYLKLGVSGRTARTAAAATILREQLG